MGIDGGGRGASTRNHASASQLRIDASALERHKPDGDILTVAKLRGPSYSRHPVVARCGPRANHSSCTLRSDMKRGQLPPTPRFSQRESV